MPDLAFAFFLGGALAWIEEASPFWFVREFLWFARQFRADLRKKRGLESFREKADQGHTEAQNALKTISADDADALKRAAHAQR